MLPATPSEAVLDLDDDFLSSSEALVVCVSSYFFSSFASLVDEVDADVDADVDVDEVGFFSSLEVFVSPVAAGVVPLESMSLIFSSGWPKTFTQTSISSAIEYTNKQKKKKRKKTTKEKKKKKKETFNERRYFRTTKM